MADIICMMALYTAIFGYMQDSNLMDPKPNPKSHPYPNHNRNSRT